MLYCLCPSLYVEHLSGFCNLAVMGSTAADIDLRYLCDTKTWGPLGKFPEVVFLDHMVNLFLDF